MPEGEDKEDALIKKAKAEYQILILNRRQKGYENIALSSKELEIKQAEDQILSINDFIAQVQERKSVIGGVKRNPDREAGVYC